MARASVVLPVPGAPIRSIPLSTADQGISPRLGRPYVLDEVLGDLACLTHAVESVEARADVRCDLGQASGDPLPEHGQGIIGVEFETAGGVEVRRHQILGPVPPWGSHPVAGATWNTRSKISENSRRSIRGKVMIRSATRRSGSGTSATRAQPISTTASLRARSWATRSASKRLR